MAVSALCAAALAIQLSWGDVVQEDAYISFRYAHHLTQGLGLVYNVGDRVEGYSNLLWTLASAAAARTSVPPETAGRYLGFLATAAAIFATAFVGRRYAGDAGGVLAAAALAANAAFLVEGAQGLETCLYVLLVTAAAARAGREFAEPTLRPLSALPLALAVLTRADGILPALALLPFYAATARENRRRFFVWLGCWAGVVAAVTAWRLAYYGSFVPNTFFVKVAPRLDALRAGGMYTLDFLWRLTPLLALVPLAARRRREFLPWAGVVAAFVIYVVVVGGDMRETFRFYLPVLPLILVAAAAALRDLGNAAAWVPRWARVAIAAAFVATPLIEFSPLFGFARDYALPAAEHRAAGRWLAANAPPGATLATTAAGIIPYYSGLPTIDMLGLNNRFIAREGRRVTDRAGHELVAADAVLDREPTYILVYEGVFSRWPLTYDDVAACARYPANVALMQSPRLAEEYVLSSAEVMPGVYFNYFFRNDDARR